MPKKFILITLIIILLSILLTGCGELLTMDYGEGVYHVTVNKDYSADMQCRIGLNNNLMAIAGTGGSNPLNEIRQRFESKGFSIANYHENKLIGVIAKKHFNSMNDLPDFKQLIETANANGITPLKLKKGLFRNQFNLDSNVDLGELSDMLDKFNMRIIMTLPFVPEKHNAVLVRDNGHTLEWHITPGANRLSMQATVLNRTNVVASIGWVIVLLLFVLVYKRKQFS